MSFIISVNKQKQPGKAADPAANNRLSLRLLPLLFGFSKSE